MTAYKYNKNDELLRTDTLNTDTEEDSVVIYKNDKNGNQLATVNRYEIPSDKKDGSYVDIDVTLGDNRLNENVVNHYNALNQLTQTLTKNYKVSFTYDAEGLRTSKTVNGEKTFFVWDGDQLVMELSGSGKVQKRYIRGNDLVYADKGENTEKKYYVTDPHGNVVQLTDESGKVTKIYEYDSFGNEVNPDSKDENPFRYCGEYYDKETEEIYLRARYYQPAVGRFLTRDTYTGESDEPESLHLYTYCENDGVNYFDPSGHKPAKKIGEGKWCKLYKKKSYSGGRKIKISKNSPPNEKKGWNSCEYPSWYNPINKHAKEKVRNAIEIKGKNKMRVTKSGVTRKGPRYAVAVGPVVLSKKFSNNNTVANYKKLENSGHFNHCYGKELDAVIKKKRKKYYIRCVAGDTKVHTYPNGVYQTGISYEDTSKKESDLSPAVIEFIGNVLGKNKELNKYTISEVIVYDSIRIPIYG